jgi:hypothetical protein
MLFFRGPSRQPGLSPDLAFSMPQRLAAYEEMWRKEETELWNWLEDRVGMDGIPVPTVNRQFESRLPRKGRKLQTAERELRDSLTEDTLSDREMGHAIRTTRERLDTLERILSKRRTQPTTGEDTPHEDL